VWRLRLMAAINDRLFQEKAAWVVRDGMVVSIPSSQLNVGDTVIVYPGVK
jgi:cation transport ATPase